MLNLETQKQAIADYLLLGLPLTSLEAIEKFGCTKLSSRVGELLKEGRIPDILKTKLKVRTRYGGTVITQYQVTKPRL